MTVVGLDPVRALVRLSTRELAAATLLIADPANLSVRHPDLAEEIRHLEEAGVIVGGEVVEAIAGMVRVINRPQLRVLVEVFRSSVVVAQAAWATPELAVLARSVGADVLEYRVADSVSLPLAVADLVGLGRGRVGQGRRPLTVAAVALDAAGPLVEGGNLAGARRRLLAAGLGRHDAARTVGLLVARRLSWRACSQWMDGSGALHARTVTVVDAGATGLWRSTAGRGAQPSVTLTPAAPSEVWRALVALVPWSLPHEDALGRLP